ncbi:hypothetical protein VFPPC_17408 [Pochonia chlamydosporia 170]|uniref:Uncharacterized protein n=1 Tax=Pochonia chlamydosporia 170 TaxID=1380566 RepID=A0A219ARP8_METCM|nr:hypothetical protein VFPPC_17408 [Pochonia chlamydosporia 170]OWT43443.1 hypothetical protein VFPPC_17408 [Pochonia chlamydosporia 170]
MQSLPCWKSSTAGAATSICSECFVVESIPEMSVPLLIRRDWFFALASITVLSTMPSATVSATNTLSIDEVAGYLGALPKTQVDTAAPGNGTTDTTVSICTQIVRLEYCSVDPRWPWLLVLSVCLLCCE